MRVGIAAEEHDLKEDQARIPDCGGAAEQWQYHLREERLNGEQQDCADAKGDAVEDDQTGGRRYAAHRTSQDSVPHRRGDTFNLQYSCPRMRLGRSRNGSVRAERFLGHGLGELRARLI
jgi:hypothetical protein